MSGNTAAPSGTSDSPVPMSASGDRGNDAQLVAVLDGRGQVVKVANIFVIEVDVDESAHLPILEDTLGDRWELSCQVIQGTLYGASSNIDGCLALGMLPH